MSGRTGVPGGPADTDGGSGEYAGPGTERSARHGPVTVTGYAREDQGIARPGVGGTGIPAGRTRFEGLADQLARLTWCWPARLALALGLYQMGRPELWRDELASWSFASRPVPGLIASARHTGATQLAYYLLLHGWIAAFGESADAMRTLSVLAMAAAAACVALVGRRLAGARAGLAAGLVFALVPSVSRFAQEIRFYALAVLVATLATLLLLRRPGPAVGAALAGLRCLPGADRLRRSRGAVGGGRPYRRSGSPRSPCWSSPSWARATSR
jgi:mannosyltransferase